MHPAVMAVHADHLAYEKQAHQARLRNEISRSKTEQGEYLRNVELARVLAKRKQKKLDANGGAEPAAAAAAEAPAGGGKAGKTGSEDKKSGYRQREAVDRGKASKGAGMDSVLSSIF